MDKKQAVEQEVRETLKHLDKIESIPCSPTFEIRLMRRIKMGESRPKTSFRPAIRKPVLIPVMCALIVLINVTSVFWLASNRATSYENETYLTAMAQEYSLDQFNIDPFTINQ